MSFSNRNESQSCRIKSDGTLWSWGLNTVGQLGNATTTNYSSPIQVGTSTNWKYVSCGVNTLSFINFADIT